MNSRIQEVLDYNLNNLSRNLYPGCGLICGIDPCGTHAIQVYWIMEHIHKNQNQVLTLDGDNLCAELADSRGVEDPTLIIYNAMKEYRSLSDSTNGYYVVSNGDQTDTIMGAGARGVRSLLAALHERCYEPDAPNFTPRISAVCNVRQGRCEVELALIRRTQLLEDEVLRLAFQYPDIIPGVGFCLTTYSGNGNPLPSFTGEPLPMPLCGSVDEILDTYWNTLYAYYRISIAVKMINLETGESEIRIKNRFEKAADTKS